MNAPKPYHLIYLKKFCLVALPFLAACSSPEDSRGGIPVSELPSRKSSLTRDEILRMVNESFPSSQYMTNEFLPNPGDFEAASASKPSTLRKVRIGMPWIASDGFSPLYIGIAKGYFESVGLEIEMVPGGPGRDHLQTLAGGQVDFAITADGMNLPIFAASRTRGDVVAIASFLKKNPVAYLSLDPDTPTDQTSPRTTKPEDFENTTIGVIRGRTHYVEFLVDHFGLDPRTVRVRWTGSTPEALVTGVVDHWAAWILDQPRLLEKSGFSNWKAFQFHDHGWNQYCDVVVVRRSSIAQEPDLLRRFLAALDQAVQFYLEQPEEAAAITSRYAVDVSLSPEDVARRFGTERDLVRGDDGLPVLHMDPTRWNEVTSLLIQYGLISDTILNPAIGVN
ncbi:MAG: ABC transporter substrate-binding protein [Puniceicoccaceae bacterium]